MTVQSNSSQFDGILKSQRDIMRRMGIGKERFMKWLEMGAPIACEVIGQRIVYSADVRCLQAWRVEAFPWKQAQTTIER